MTERLGPSFRKTKSALAVAGVFLCGLVGFLLGMAYWPLPGLLLIVPFGIGCGVISHYGARWAGV